MSTDTYAVLDREELLPHLLRRRAQELPDRVFVEEVTGRAATYAQLHEQALTWASALQRVGVRDGEMVASMQPSCIDELATWLGLTWLRAAQVPLNLDYRERQLAYSLDLCDVRIAVVRREYLERFVAVAERTALEVVVLADSDDVPTGMPFRVVGRTEFLDGAAPLEDAVGPDPWDTSCVIFTSGTTGPSKAVLLPWPQLHLQATRTFPIDEMDDRDVWYGPWPTFHLTGKFPLYMMAICNGRLVLKEQFSVTELVDDFYEYGITTAIIALALTPLLDKREPQPTDIDIPLRHIVMVPVLPHYEQFAKRWGVRISTCYAMTEIGPVLGLFPDDLSPTNFQSVGVPRQGYPGVEARVVDANDVDVPTGEMGELIVRTASPWTLSAGYHKMPEANANAWRNGWFHTGDAFKRDEAGNFYFCDRIKDAIRRRGENISTFEVEGYLHEHSDVLECAAVPVRLDDPNDEEVKVVVVRRPGADLTAEDLLAFLIPRMPRFMVPRYVEFAEELPKTETHKVKKMLLRENPLNDRTWDRVAAGIEVPR